MVLKLFAEGEAENSMSPRFTAARVILLLDYYLVVWKEAHADPIAPTVEVHPENVRLE